MKVFAVIDTNVLVSDNLKHFPKSPRIVSPSEMMKILKNASPVLKQEPSASTKR